MTVKIAVTLVSLRAEPMLMRNSGVPLTGTLFKILQNHVMEFVMMLKMFGFNIAASLTNGSLLNSR